jgi:guanylate kinase
MQETRKGMLLVISGPSGTGKGTLVERLLQDDPSFEFSVSCTTRKCRTNEIPDVHYHFIDDEHYDKLLAEDAFLEHATVHGHRYGTLKSEVYEKMEQGKNVVLDIDPQGARTVMSKDPSCVSIFVLPPSYSELRKRLHTRNTEDEEEISKRLFNARGEVQQMHLYQYLLVNDELTVSMNLLKQIVQAEKLKSCRYFPIIGE